jgi:hypothetical protein
LKKVFQVATIRQEFELREESGNSEGIMVKQSVLWIKRVDDNAPNILELHSTNGRTTVTFETESTQTRDDQPAGKTELIFERFGDQYFLSQVWVAGSASGSKLLKSRMEKRLEDGGTQSEKHSIAALLKHLKP